MAHYYVDFVNPPPFGHSLPGAVGYVSVGGLTVLYGLKTRGDIQRQNRLAVAPRGWPDGDNVKPRRVDPVVERIAKLANADTGANLPNNAARRHCAGCGEVPERITRHHIVPKQVGSDQRTIRLCLECHTEIHRLPNRHIAAMSAAEQVEFINIRRPRTANFPPPPSIPRKTKAQHEAEGPRRDFVLQTMMSTAGKRSNKHRVDHRNRHHGTGA